MDFNSLKEELGKRCYLEELLLKNGAKRQGKQLTCIFHGDKAASAGIVEERGKAYFHCFACEDNHNDIFNVIGKLYNIPNTNDTFKERVLIAAKEFDLNHEAEKKQTMQHKEKKSEIKKENYKDYYMKCNKNLNDAYEKEEWNYLKKRGITKETANRFNLGYENKDISYKKETGEKGTHKIKKALIIPVTESDFTIRNITDEKENRYRKVGKNKPFNMDALKEAKEIFITEGIIDAISIEQLGFKAVAISGLSLNEEQIEKIKENKNTIILALDNDEAGLKAGAGIKEKLENAGIKVYNTSGSIYGKYKDANEALINEAGAFMASLKEAVKAVKEDAAKEEEERKQAYLETAASRTAALMMLDKFSGAKTPFTPTGFKKLDNILDGGLYEGLYFIGAISSLGKTTLALQIADQIAYKTKKIIDKTKELEEAAEEKINNAASEEEKDAIKKELKSHIEDLGNPQDIIIFSLEMAEKELISKSISRNTFLLASQRKEYSINDAKTARGITTSSRFKNYSRKERNLISDAVAHYANNIGERIWIKEGVGDIGVKEIREEVEKHIKETGIKPLVIIDYLQIIAPHDFRASDKQNTDKAVTELKRISRDYKIPIIGISSFNRGNYDKEITMAAFKESGSIEYSSDVLIGLQFKGVGSPNFDVDEAKQKEPREITLKILKNRNGETGVKIDLEYIPKFNYYSEC